MILYTVVSENPLLHVLFSQYIGYARKYVHPKIGKDAAKNLQVGFCMILY